MQTFLWEMLSNLWSQFIEGNCRQLENLNDPVSRHWLVKIVLWLCIIVLSYFGLSLYLTSAFMSCLMYHFVSSIPPSCPPFIYFRYDRIYLFSPIYALHTQLMNHSCQGFVMFCFLHIKTNFLCVWYLQWILCLLSWPHCRISFENTENLCSKEVIIQRHGLRWRLSAFPLESLLCKKKVAEI